MSYSYIYTNLSGNIDITPLSGNDCNVTVNGNGSFNTVQTSTGGSSEPAVIIQNNDGGGSALYMQLYKNSSTPAGNDGIGSISFQGNSSTGVKREYARIQGDIRDPTNIFENGSISLSAAINSTTPTEFVRIDGSNGEIQMYRQLDTRSNAITNSQGGGITFLQSQNNQSIVFLASGGFCNINPTATRNYQVSSNAFRLAGTTNSYITSNQKLTLTSTSNNIEITQSIGNSTKLTTSIANVNYYPEYVIENIIDISLNIPLPSIPYQRLQLINKAGNACAFQLSSKKFSYNGLDYNVYTLNNQYNEQDFIADSTITYWIPFSDPTYNGSFSNN